MFVSSSKGMCGVLSVILAYGGIGGGMPFVLFFSGGLGGNLVVEFYGGI